MAVIKKLTLARCIAIAGVLFGVANPALALNVGFDATVSASASDNINEANRGDELDGSQLRGQISVFGDHTSQRIVAGFTGELGSRKQFGDEGVNDDVLTLTRFYGSVEIALSQKALSWYFGDVIGGSSREDGTQTTDEDELLQNRRNIFITGPVLSLDLGSTKAFDASLFFIHNSDETDAELASLYTFQSNYRSTLAAGREWGVSFGNIFVDNPDDLQEPDYNRSAVDFYVSSTRGLNVLRVGLGGTRYQADDFAVNGLSAQLRWDRAFSASSTIYAAIDRDLVDETLTAVNTLATTGDAELPEAAGIYNNTTLTFGYNYTTTPSSFGWFAGIGDSAYEAVVDTDGFSEQASDLQDQTRYFTGLTASQALSNRLVARANATYRQEEFKNTDDFTESISGGAELIYSIGRSFELLFGVQHEANEGESGSGATASVIDTVENRARIALTYKPPSRADRNLLVRLKSLVY